MAELVQIYIEDEYRSDDYPCDLNIFVKPENAEKVFKKIQDKYEELKEKFIDERETDTLVDSGGFYSLFEDFVESLDELNRVKFLSMNYEFE